MSASEAARRIVVSDPPRAQKAIEGDMSDHPFVEVANPRFTNVVAEFGPPSRGNEQRLDGRIAMDVTNVTPLPLIGYGLSDMTVRSDVDEFIRQDDVTLLSGESKSLTLGPGGKVTVGFDFEVSQQLEDGIASVFAVGTIFCIDDDNLLPDGDTKITVEGSVGRLYTAGIEGNGQVPIQSISCSFGTS